MHLNKPEPCSVSFGCRRSKILMNDIAKFLCKLFTHFLLIDHTTIQINDTSPNNIKGSNIERNALNTALDLNPPLIS
jgi:hypothetical protein